MTDAIQSLFDEHDVISEAVDVAVHAEQLIATDADRYEEVVRALLEFFRVYADGFHHHKEEEILFPEMSKKNDLLGDGVIKEMLENHQDFRDMLQGIENFLEQKNYAKVQQKLMAYTDALQDHIAVENDEVFQVAEALLDPGELERIYFQFCDADRETDDKLSGDNRHTKQQLVSMMREIKGRLA